MRPLIVATAVIILFCISCNKEPETPKGSSKIMIGTTTTDSASYNKVTVSAQVTSLGGNSIQQHGFCWGTASNPEISGQHSSLGSMANPGKFSEQITGLATNTKYYVRPYIIYIYGTLYGQHVEATTKQLSKPTITTGVITDIKCNSAKISANISSDGGNTIAKRGFCWNTTGNPSLTNFIGSTNDGTGTGSFTTSMTNLLENTTYYAVAYATNSEGTAYSEIKQALTLQLQLPQVTTTNVTNINATSATCGGDVTFDGNGTVSARGVCWSILPNPTINDNRTNDGIGIGVFTSIITGLTNNANYYIKAFATNSIGTSYGNEVIFPFYLNVPGPLVTDIDGIVYESVRIGNQIWMKENLKTTKFNNGTQIPQITDNSEWATLNDGAYCDFMNNSNNGDIYGHLYNFFAVTDSRKLCPAGWHVPSKSDWDILINYLGGVNVAGTRLKEPGTEHWETAGGDNMSGFTGLAGSWRGGDGLFYYYTRFVGCFWTSTLSKNSTNNPWTLFLLQSANVEYNNDSYHTQKAGNSIRCIKD